MFYVYRYLEETFGVSLATTILPQINSIVKKCLLGLKEVRILDSRTMLVVISASVSVNVTYILNVK